MLCQDKIFNIPLVKPLNIIIQISFIFIFLCLFYFFYVVYIENTEFIKQINLIVDNLMQTVKDNLKDIAIPSTKITKEEIDILIDGIIDIQEEQITKSSTQAIKDINTANNKIKTNVFILIGIIFVMVIIIFVVFRCVPFFTTTVKSSIVVFSVGLVEFIFLTFVSSRYIAANPNKIKYAIGQAAHTYIVNNKLI